MNQPLVTAIVLNFRSPRDTAACAEMLRRQTIAKQTEILVVDNCSADESVGFLRNRFRSAKDIRIVETSKNLGYGRGNDYAIASARGTFIMVINPDNGLEPDGLERMVAAMDADPGIGILAPQLVQEDGSIRDSFRSFPTLLDIVIKRTRLRRFFPERMERYTHHASSHQTVQDVDWIAGACFLMRRSLYDQLGGFDPRFFLFFEDTDLCRRCWEAGKRVVYYPTIHATDRRRRLSDGGFMALFTKKTARIHLISAFKYFWKWRGRGLPGRCSAA